MSQPFSNISIHRYSMRSKSALNAKSVRVEHYGALIRVDFNGVFGYGCIHPWQELGDLSLNENIALLQQSELTPLTKRSLACAEIDSAARARSENLFTGLSVPDSHATLTMDSWSVMEAVDSGFRTAKLKVGRALSREAFFIRQQANRFPKLRWRFDFNHSQCSDSVKQFLGELGDVLDGKIDFLEDPCLLNENIELLDLPVSVAVDKKVEDSSHSSDYLVIKPAVNDPKSVMNRMDALDGKSQRLVFTSYMDHPLGQCFSAYEAAMAYKEFPHLVDLCGLQTHGLFGKSGTSDGVDNFIDAMGSVKPRFHIPDGTGLGFDDLLENLEWTQLT